MKKILTSIKIVLLLLISTGIESVSAQEAAVGSIELLEEWFTEVAAPEGIESDCGYLVVPEFHSVVNERSLKIAFVRLKTPSDFPGAPLFKTHGGPGGDEVQFLPDAPSMSWHVPILEIRDVVIFNHRGIEIRRTFSYL